jgi:hypothetical protein
MGGNVEAIDHQRKFRGSRGSHDELRLTARWNAAKPAPVEAPAIVPPVVEGRVLATFSTYDGLKNAMRARVDELQLTRLEVDELSGNQSGYSSKVLCGIKKFGRRSLGDTLGAVGSYLALVESPEQVAKLTAVIEALSALSALCAAAVALGVTREEFEQVAGAVPKKSSMGSLGGALVSAGCKMALVEDSAATKGVMARAKKRQRPLRPAPSADGWMPCAGERKP